MTRVDTQNGIIMRQPLPELQSPMLWLQARLRKNLHAPKQKRPFWPRFTSGRRSKSQNRTCRGSQVTAWLLFASSLGVGDVCIGRPSASNLVSMLLEVVSAIHRRPNHARDLWLQPAALNSAPASSRSCRSRGSPERATTTQ